MKLKRWALGLLRSPALVVAVVFGTSGVAFALANLLLARALPPREFGLFALALALMNVAIPLAPVGAQGVMNRHRLPVTGRLLARVLITAGLAAGLTALIGGTLYAATGLLLLSLIAAGIIGGGSNELAAAWFQSRQSFAPSLGLTQGANAVILLAALVTLARNSSGAALPVAIVAAGHLAAAGIGWVALFAGRERGPATSAPFPWAESLAIAGLQGAVVFLLQLERLVIPKFLSLEALATFGVLAALVIAPFRMLQMGVNFALLPRLRSAEPAARPRLLLWEAAAVGPVVVLASAAVWLLVPLVERTLLAGKYELGAGLVLAALVAGWVRIASAFADAAVTAVAPAPEIVKLNWMGWLFVLVAVIGAAAGSRYGIPGVLYGASLGWVGRFLLAARIARRHLRAGVAD